MYDGVSSAEGSGKPMPYLKLSILSLGLTLWFSWLSLPFAVLPPCVLAIILKTKKSSWKTSTSQHRVHYFLLGLLGGIVGEYVAVSTLCIGEEWICHTLNQLCNDGQGGLAFIFTIPFCSFVCSGLALFWTWLSLRFREDAPWASVFQYSGPSRLLNWNFAIAIQLVYWSLFWFGFFYLTIKIIL